MRRHPLYSDNSRSVPYEVLDTRWLAPSVKRLVVRAPHVTRNYGPGQFVIVRADSEGERIPLTVAHCDRNAGTIVLIVQAVGATTRALCNLQQGDKIVDVAGPLGKHTEIPDVEHALLIGGGVGTAVIYPQAKALKDYGSRVAAIIGGRARSHVILEPELAQICDAVYPCSDDGSYGFHGFVTDRLKQFLATTKIPVDIVICAGPVPMMSAVAEVTRAAAIHTVASLNPIMVDGTGMCGGCRVSCGNHAKFACIDGPEFDAHQVDFAELLDRLGTYREFEKCARERVS